MEEWRSRYLGIGLIMRKNLAILALILSLSGCGNQDIKSDNENRQNTVSQVGTNGQLIPIQSDNVRSAGYDEASLVMTVQFDNGALYEYYGVPTELWTSFIAAQPHPWSQVGYPRLVQGGIPYKRIG
ncbi:MAG: KTSC domain-containing protein [Polynucleobacter sp.]|nr:KTSC domain-containing protein [Polynucleobacter sp.]